MSKEEDKIIFDDENHKYTVGKIKLPSVTQILSAVGMYKGLENIPKHILDVAAERGKTIHTIIEYHLNGELDESSIDPELMGYFQAYLACRADHPEIFDNLTYFEKTVYSKKFGYCGRVDAGGDRIMIDFKTTAQESAVTALQLSGYWLSEHEDYLLDKPDVLAGLYLHRDATYNLVKCVYQPMIWLNCVAVHNWQKKNGI